MKKLTVDSINPEASIYVRNKTNGDFLIPIRDASGSSELVSIPKTFIPIMVTNFAEGMAFKKSSDFRKAVSKGYLELIDVETAENELAEEESIMELERLRKTDFSNINYETNRQVTPMEAIKDVGAENVSSKVKDIIIRSDITEDDKFALLITEHKLGNLKLEDYEFIIMTCSDKGKISKWASKVKIGVKNNIFGRTANG